MPTTGCATSIARSREQGRRNDYAHDVKLGPGGIREIEFIVQALQLVRGGREPDLRARGTLPALAALAERGLLPPAASTRCATPTSTCATLEHRLQYRDDRQTQMLPADAAEREALARTMGAASAAELDRVLAAHRAAVSAQFSELFGTARARDVSSAATADEESRAAAVSTVPALPMLAAVWDNGVDAERARATLAAAEV